MRGSNEHTKNKTSNIQCIEVLISKSFIVKNANLHWTLSVYSLENQPVTDSRRNPNSEIFHFMVFDWRRTVKRLLQGNQVPYVVIDYFEPATIYADSMEEYS